MTPDESEASPTRTRIPRCSADATAEHVGELLSAHGAVIVERLIDDALCDRLADQLGPWIETNGATRVVADSHRTAGDATSFAPR